MVDTGSTDRTREIAAENGARVFEFAWCDDFAAARNESLRHATGQWIFWLDGDEWLDAENHGRFSVLLEQVDPKSAYILEQHSPTPDGGRVIHDQARLLPNLPGMCWQGRVHEQTTPAIQRLDLKVRKDERCRRTFRIPGS